MNCKYCGDSALGLTDTCGDCWHGWINDGWRPAKKPASRASRDWSSRRPKAMGAPAPQRTAVALRAPSLGVG